MDFVGEVSTKRRAVLSEFLVLGAIRFQRSGVDAVQRDTTIAERKTPQRSA